MKKTSKKGPRIKGGKSKNSGQRKNFGRLKPKKKQPKPRVSSDISGVMRIGPRGRGHVTIDGAEEEVLIEHNFLRTALHGDEVEISLHGATVGSELKGEVLRVTKRARRRFVGKLEQTPGKGACFLIPDDRKMYKDIFIPRKQMDGTGKDCNHDHSGQKALVEITRWIDVTGNPEGKVLKILGKPGDHEVELQSILLSKGIEYDFPKIVEKEAEAIAKNFPKQLQKAISESWVSGIDGKTKPDSLGRRDMREVPTFTIDPGDAKDFDDALSFRKLMNDVYEIGIHIADVSTFVTPGSKLDEEAKKRANSVYLVDRTIPMLPEALSNNICSLVPKEDRFTYSAVLTMDSKGHILDRWFGHSIIHSDRRFTYEDAQKTLDQKKGKLHDELALLNRIAKGCKKERMAGGSISFETDEVKVKLDAKKRPIEITVKERIETQMLIEEFMLMANQEVAVYLGKASKRAGGGSLYRVHPLPDADKIESLDVFVKAMGYSLINKSGQVNARDINNLLRQIEGKPEEELIQTAVLRSMSKAVYSTKNIGHFGIGFGFYTHFTSPIRRYADILVHRALDTYLSGQKLSRGKIEEYRKLAEEISVAERDAERAERESIKFKQAEYMQSHIGKTFEGVISGVVEWGLYVEENTTKAEGLVPIRMLGDDFYNLDEKNFQIIGSRTKKKFRLGDKVKIKVLKVDPERRQIDYTLA